MADDEKVPGSTGSDTTPAPILKFEDPNKEDDPEVHQKSEIPLNLQEAKNLLEKTKAGEETTADKTKVLDWLIILSNQGNAEATDLLHAFAKHGIGVSDENAHRVSECLHTSDVDKSVQHAAKSLFKKLTTADETKALSKKSFVKNLKEVTTDKLERRLLELAGKSEKGDSLTEEDFTNIVMKCIHGNAEELSKIRFDTDIDEEVYKKAKLSEKVLKYPGKTAQLGLDYILEYAASNGRTAIMAAIPTHQLQVIALMFVYTFLSAELVFAIVPPFLFVVSFLTMAVCSLQMVYNKKKIKNVSTVAKLLHRFNPAVDNESLELEYTYNSLTSYAVFFAAFVFMVINYSLSSKTYLPCSELAVGSAFMAFCCFIAIHHTMVLEGVSMGFNIASTLPTIFANFPEIPVITAAVKVLTGPLMSVEVADGIHLHFGIPSLFYMLLPVVFIALAAGKGWRGFYQTVLPHLVVFSWWQVSILFYTHSSWVGLLRSSVGWLLLPFFGVFGIIFVVWYTVKIMATQLSFKTFLKVLVTLLLVALPTFMSLWRTSRKKRSKQDGFLHSRVGKIAMTLVFLFFASPFVLDFDSYRSEVPQKSLQWTQYIKHCGHHLHPDSHAADVQIRCAIFNSMTVEWEGKIQTIQVTSVSNPVDAALNAIPVSFLADWLRCVYGKKHKPCNDDAIQNSTLLDPCQFIDHYKHSCHVNHYNKYLFSVTVDLPASAVYYSLEKVYLEAGNGFKDILQTLREGNQVSFKGVLSNAGNNPKVHVQKLKCMDCVEVITPLTAVEEEPSVMVKMSNSLLATFNFFASPLFEYEIGA